jgi:formylglycine-generating enzyme required for sulfatase activity
VSASVLRPQFTIPLTFESDLSGGVLSKAMRQVFSKRGFPVPRSVDVSRHWGPGWGVRMIGGSLEESMSTSFYIVREQGALAVYVGGVPSRYLFGEAYREDPRRPWGYNRKPIVDVEWVAAEYMCNLIATDQVRYRLPTEAEWEKAARGGLIGCQYPWGDEPPSEERCDFGRFDQFSILPMRRFPPNGYGLYAMSGCVWEWTADWYDAEYYRESATKNPTGPKNGTERVLRGGSWADCAEVVTVSFRMSRDRSHCPNFGFRPCRLELPAT